MRRTSSSPAKAFYLAVFALFNIQHVTGSTPPQRNPDACALNPSAKVSDACASYADLDALNDRLHPYVRNLANNTDFFGYYRLNLYNKQCPFWSDESGLCGNSACAVTTLENEKDVPDIWKAEELSKLQGPKAQHPGRKQQRDLLRPLLGELGAGVGESCVVEYDDPCDEVDYCVPEDESATAKGDYVSLSDNPERFTGYAGHGARMVWEAIYRENCFAKGSQKSSKSSALGLSAQPFPVLSQNQAQAALDFKHVLQSSSREKGGMQDDLELEMDDQCLEKRVFYRVISGMHAAISTHLCYDYLNQSTGEWGPNLACYQRRLHNHPEWISNLYFNYAFLLRAVGKLRDYVQDYTFCTGDPIQDARTKLMIRTLADAIPSGPEIFDESVMFTDQDTMDGITLKEDFRNRFRNVSRIMDCVGCDKCRLWGKVQTNGFGTALKVLFEFGNGHVGDEKPVLRRTDLVALINTLDKTSSALKAIETFRRMTTAEQSAIDPLPASASQDQSSRTGSNRSPLETRTESLDDLDDFPDTESMTPPMPPRTLKEDFKREFDLVFRTWIYVLKSWARLPQTLGSILVLEGQRLWDFWLGRPMRGRSWEVKFPSPADLEEVWGRGRDEI